MTDLERNKQTVIAFITHAFNDKQPADAVAQYVGRRTFNTIRSHPTAARHLSSSQLALQASFRRQTYGCMADSGKLPPRHCRTLGSSRPFGDGTSARALQCFGE